MLLTIKKIIVAVLLLASLGLLIYCINNPYIEITDCPKTKAIGVSLATGTQPYSSLYGYNPTSGSSTIIVTAPVNIDVLVMIKNNSGSVMQHAYIAGGDTYSFYITAGYYQVYFICGSDWDDNTQAPNGQMGFFSNSSTSKDNMVYIADYQTLTYTLQSTMNGNFMPQNANLRDAF